jgi:hypothetical protein
MKYVEFMKYVEKQVNYNVALELQGRLPRVMCELVPMVLCNRNLKYVWWASRRAKLSIHIHISSQRIARSTNMFIAFYVMTIMFPRSHSTQIHNIEYLRSCTTTYVFKG